MDGHQRLLAKQGMVLSQRQGAQALEAADKTAFSSCWRLAWWVGVLSPIARSLKRGHPLTSCDNLVWVPTPADQAQRAPDNGGCWRDESGVPCASAGGQDRGVHALQADDVVVVIVDDGVTDAPALTQPDVGVVMGAAGIDVAIEAVDVALMHDGRRIISEAMLLGRRARRPIRQNLGFRALYNIVGSILAVPSMLLPVFSAAQSLPDAAIMLNSAWVLPQRAAPAVHTIASDKVRRLIHMML